MLVTKGGFRPLPMRYCVMSLRLSNSIRFLHWKAFFPIWSNFGGNSTETRPEFLSVICTSFALRAYSPMDCSLSGKFICTSFELLKECEITYADHVGNVHSCELIAFCKCSVTYSSSSLIDLFDTAYPLKMYLPTVSRSSGKSISAELGAHLKCIILYVCRLGNLTLVRLVQ